MNEQQKQVLEERNYTSTKISDMLRYIAFGLLAIIYSFFISDSQFTQNILHRHEVDLLIVSFFSIAAIVLDYLQSLFAYFSINQAINNKNFKFLKSYFYKSTYYIFWIKQITLFIGVICFCLIMYLSVVVNSEQISEDYNYFTFLYLFYYGY